MFEVHFSIREECPVLGRILDRLGILCFVAIFLYVCIHGDEVVAYVFIVNWLWQLS